MNVIKVTTINEDGSVKFEGYFGPNEVKFILESGVNILLQHGAISLMNEEDEAEEDDELILDSTFSVEPPDKMQ